ncbi:hypothetical protein I3843_08G030600 [Carya illinoinensis]|nr:hypothetical protein I3843_08G030600 [Carya illinoinensis]
MTICQESNRVQRISVRKSCSLLAGEALRAIPTTRMHLLLLSWLGLIPAVQLVLALVLFLLAWATNRFMNTFNRLLNHLLMGHNKSTKPLLNKQVSSSLSLQASRKQVICLYWLRNHQTSFNHIFICLYNPPKLNKRMKSSNYI